ncbi:MAG: DUF2585 family protein [bacterium]|nr:DUF2585 family protein [bacterium]
MDSETHERNLSIPTLLSVGITISMSLLLWWMGRIWWCKQGDWAIFVKEAWGSPHTSQHVIDPYVLTHVLHGVAFCLIAALLFPKLAIGWRFVIAIAAEAGWELLENSTFIIEKYRANTASFDYFGDSIVNSIADVAACAAGFWIAAKLGAWKSLAFFVLVEIILILSIRDSLLINIIMLIYPIDAIKLWQAGI